MTEPAPKKKKTTNIIAAVLGVAVAGVIIFAIASGHSGNDGLALTACHGFVTDQLKSPGSAHFSAEQLDHDGATYTLTGTVDSDNSFGSPVRNTFTCTESYSDGTFTLISLDGLVN